MCRTISNRNQDFFSNLILKEQTTDGLGLRSFQCSLPLPAPESQHRGYQSDSGFSGYDRVLAKRFISACVRNSIGYLTPAPRSSAELPWRVFATLRRRDPSHLRDDRCCHSLAEDDNSVLYRLGQILVIPCHFQHL